MMDSQKLRYTSPMVLAGTTHLIYRSFCRIHPSTVSHFLQNDHTMQLLNIGHGNTVALERIVAVINTGSSPARKLKEAAKNENRLIDVTEGRRTRSILVMDSNHIVLSSVQTDTISQRIIQLQQGTQIEQLAAEGRITAVRKSK